MLNDICEKVTEAIRKQLEKGDLPTWVKPWKNKGGAGGIPMNAETEKEYQGINTLALWVTAEVKGYASNVWGTFKQWSDKGEKVRRNEKGTLGVYWNKYEVKSKNNEDETTIVPFLSSFYVFNKCQLQSYDPEKEEKHEKKPLDQRIEAVETFVKRTGAIIEHGGDVACYIPSLDKIRMPYMNAFIDLPDCTAAEAYHGVLFHELTHWTGKDTRLNRDLSGRFGDAKYSKEEPVAEIGSAILCVKYDIEKEPIPNHAVYIKSFLDRLSEKDGPKTFIQAASHASKAVAYLHSLQHQ